MPVLRRGQLGLAELVEHREHVVAGLPDQKCPLRHAHPIERQGVAITKEFEIK